MKLVSIWYQGTCVFCLREKNVCSMEETVICHTLTRGQSLGSTGERLHFLLSKTRARAQNSFYIQKKKMFVPLRFDVLSGVQTGDARGKENKHLGTRKTRKYLSQRSITQADWTSPHNVVQRHPSSISRYTLHCEWKGVEFLVNLSFISVAFVSSF